MRSSFFLVLALALLGACTGDFLGPGNGSLQLVPDSIQLLIGERSELEVRDGDEKLHPKTVEWLSFGRAIADVNEEGTVWGVGPGTTAVVARHRDRQATAQITSIELLFDRVTAGRLHSCGWEQDGAVYCWGYNSHGQLGSPGGSVVCGDGAPCEFKPVPVAGDLAFRVLAAGDRHTCGIATDGAAWCWGGNEVGQLGRGTAGTAVFPTPQAVTGGHAFTAVATGEAHSCALTAAGQAYCWGDNDQGQLGDGTSTDRSEPVAVDTDLRFVQIAAGNRHTCGLRETGTVYCWGRNDERQLGDNTGRSSARPVPTFPAPAMASVSAGEFHTCAITTDGAAYCWGRNNRGQLGDATTRTRSIPTRVRGGHDFTDLATGGTVTCGVTGGQETYCWGWNGYGQLGSGNTAAIESAVPVRAHGDASFSAIAGGWLHVCATVSGEATRCWGYNGGGQLGRLEPSRPCPTEPGQRCALQPQPVLGSR